MNRLREIRLTRAQIAAVAVLSSIATASIIVDALGRTDAQTAAVQALRHRAVIVERHASGSVAAPPAAIPTSAAPPLSPQPVISPIGSVGSAAPGAAAPTPAQGSGAGTGTGTGSGSPGQNNSTTSAAPKQEVKHVFVIALSTSSFAAAFGRGSEMPYLGRTLRRKGTLLANYRTLGAGELPDYLAMISGQAPNPDTQAGCATYAEFPTGAAPAANGVVPGLGCIYPNTVITVGDQVTASGHGWRGYIQGMGPSTCVQPSSGAVDNAPLPGAGPNYDTRHNPFIYFHSLLDLGGCASDDVSLTQLPADLRSARMAPTYAFIAPDGCLDASAASCPDGGASGMAGEDAFLRQWVPRILHSAAYKHGGVLIITLAHSAATGQTASSADGPVRTGALVLSHYGRAGAKVSTRYDPYSLLRSLEDLLGYKPLAMAKSAGSFVHKALPGLG